MFSQETVSRVNKPFFKHKRDKGNTGEDIACEYLERRGLKVIARNYQRKWGELDIVAQNGEAIHFFEVKSVLVSGRERSIDWHRPEENVHDLKIRHIRRMVETFLAEWGRGADVEFHFHVLCVFMNMRTRRARVKWIKDVIL